jgi:HAD superfamily hydrolase (TIGR01509 family)
MAEDTGASSDTIETIFWHYNDDVCRGEITMAQFNAALAEHLEVDSIAWQDYYLSSIEPIESVQDVLIEASKHYKVGLLTNIMPGLVDAMLARGILPNIRYDAIIDSSVVGAIKPEAEIFEIATEQAGVPANEILLIDDARVNVMAAEKSGWHVLWFDDYRLEESLKKVRSSLEA